MKIGETRNIEVATAGAPMLAVISAHQTLRISEKPGSIISMGIHHDDGCPCLDGHGMGDCTCEIVQLVARRLA